MSEKKDSIVEAAEILAAAIREHAEAVREISHGRGHPTGLEALGMHLAGPGSHADGPVLRCLVEAIEQIADKLEDRSDR